MPKIIQTLCRICEHSKNLTDLSLTPNRELLSKYLECANVSFNTNDSLPKYICQECITILNNSYEFKKKCESTQEKFYDLLNGTITDDNCILLYDTDSDQMEELITVFKEEPIENFIVSELDISASTPVTTDIKNTEIPTEKIKQEYTDNSSYDEKDESNDFIDIIKAEKGIEYEKYKQKCTEVKESEINTQSLEYIPEKPYKCKGIGCPESFDHEIQYLQHKEKPHQCPVCNMVMENIDFLIHHYGRAHKEQLKVVYPKVYNCKICKKILVNSSHLTSHMKKHIKQTNPKLIVYKCDNCAEKFENENLLDCHRIISHKYWYKYCMKCNKKFLTRLSFDEHDCKDDCKVQCRLCHVKFPTKYMHLHAKCDKMLLKSKTLNRHMITLKNNKKKEQHHCYECFLKFDDSIQWKKHIDDMHSNQRMEEE